MKNSTFRLTALAALFLMMFCTLGAQNKYSIDKLAGKWSFSQSEEKDGSTVDILSRITLGKDNTCSQEAILTMKVSVKDEETGETNTLKMDINIKASGTWTYDGNEKIVMQYNPKTMNATLTSSDLPTLVTSMLKKALVSEFKKELKKPENYRILSLTDTELKIIDMDSKDAEAETYKRTS